MVVVHRDHQWSEPVGACSTVCVPSDGDMLFSGVCLIRPTATTGQPWQEKTSWWLLQW